MSESTDNKNKTSAAKELLKNPFALLLLGITIGNADLLVTWITPALTKTFATQEQIEQVLSEIKEIKENLNKLNEQKNKGSLSL